MDGDDGGIPLDVLIIGAGTSFLSLSRDVRLAPLGRSIGRQERA